MYPTILMTIKGWVSQFYPPVAGKRVYIYRYHSYGVLRRQKHATPVS
jgi:hypothetical protein